MTIKIYYNHYDSYEHHRQALLEPVSGLVMIAFLSVTGCSRKITIVHRLIKRKLTGNMRWGIVHGLGPEFPSARHSGVGLPSGTFSPSARFCAVNNAKVASRFTRRSLDPVRIPVAQFESQ